MTFKLFLAIITVVSVIAAFAIAFSNYEPGQYTDEDDNEGG